MDPRRIIQLRLTNRDKIASIPMYYGVEDMLVKEYFMRNVKLEF